MPSSSSVTAQCPECGAKFRLKDAAAGKKVKCRSCEAVFVPSGGNGKSAAAPGADEFDDFGAERMQALPPRRLPHPTRKKKVEKPEAVPDDELETVRRKALGKDKKPGVSPVLIGATAVVGLGLLAVVVLLIRGSGGPSIAPVTEYDRFQDDVAQAFSTDYPKGWTVQKGGRPGSVIYARFLMGDAQIKMETSMAASAIGDIAGAFSQGEELDESQTPVAQVHDHLRSDYVDAFSEYQEVSTSTVKSQRGDTRLSEFTAAGGLLGGKIRGYRATMLGRYQVTVIAQCPEADWEVCQPAFMHVIQSVGN